MNGGDADDWNMKGGLSYANQTTTCGRGAANPGGLLVIRANKINDTGGTYSSAGSIGHATCPTNSYPGR